MKKVTGLGGVFFKAEDRDALLDWYRQHLGIDCAEYGFSFLWRLFDWESVGDKSRGYFLFIPWGDHSAPATRAQPASRPR